MAELKVGSIIVQAVHRPDGWNEYSDGGVEYKVIGVGPKRIRLKRTDGKGGINLAPETVKKLIECGTFIVMKRGERVRDFLEPLKVTQTEVYSFDSLPNTLASIRDTASHGNVSFIHWSGCKCTVSISQGTAKELIAQLKAKLEEEESYHK